MRERKKTIKKKNLGKKRIDDTDIRNEEKKD